MSGWWFAPLGERGDPVDEDHRGLEIRKPIGALDRLAGSLPPRRLRQLGRHLRLAQRAHRDTQRRITGAHSFRVRVALPTTFASSSPATQGDRVVRPPMPPEPRGVVRRHDAALQLERAAGGRRETGGVRGLGRAEIALGVGVHAHAPGDPLGHPGREQVSADLVMASRARTDSRRLQSVGDDRLVDRIAADVVQQAGELKLLVGGAFARELGALERVLELGHDLAAVSPGSGTRQRVEEPVGHRGHTFANFAASGSRAAARDRGRGPSRRPRPRRGRRANRRRIRAAGDRTRRVSRPRNGRRSGPPGRLEGDDADAGADIGHLGADRQRRRQLADVQEPPRCVDRRRARTAGRGCSAG